MDGLHIPPWDTTGSSFQEYPSAIPDTTAQAAKQPARREKGLRLEQEKLQTMINSIVRLSAPSGSAAGAGGDAAGTASLAQRKTKKQQKRLQREPGDVSHKSTQNERATEAEHTAPNSMAEISHLADCQQQPKLGKRKAVEQVAPRASQEQSKPSLEAQPLPASEASQQEGARKRTRTRKSRGPGLGQEARQSRKDMMQNGRSLTLEAAAMLPAVLPRHGQSGAGSGEDGQPDVHQSLPGNPARDSAPSAQAPESVRKKRSRNKFKPDATAGQPGLPKSTDAAPAAQTPDAAKKKRNRNKFKQMDAAGPEVLPKSLVPEVGEHHSSKHDAAAPHKKAAKQQGLLAQRSPEPAPSAMQHDKESEQRPGKQMKGTAKRQESKAAGHPMRPPQSAGQAENGQATSGGQVAGAGASSRQKEDGLLGKMRAKLAGSQFRWLNEQLYTCPGSQAFELMQEQPQLFTQYHEGFKQQTAKWPLQPIQAAAAYLAKHSRKAVVADFGCGDAELARMAPQETVHSLDLVTSAPGVIACNMADTPLDSASVDVAVFCLALMGTDYPSFLQEAARVLKPHGTIWIAEVRSRFVPEDANQEDYHPFLQAMSGLGFSQKSVNYSNSHFVTFELQRQKPSADSVKVKWPQLRACTYKKR